VLILSDVWFVIGAAFAVFFFYSLFRQGNRFSSLFALMCLSVAIYVIGYGFELRAGTVEEIRFFLKVEYFGQPFMGAFWLLFAYKFHVHKSPSVKLNIMALVIPALTLFFSATNEFHRLFYTDVSAVRYDGFILAKITRGPWYYVNVIYSFGALFLGIFLFFSAWKKTGYQVRTQAFWLLAGSVWPAIFDAVYLLGWSPYGLALDPVAFVLLAACFFNALFRYDFLDLTDMVRSVAFSEIQEGILVLDVNNRLIDFNRAAQRFFPWVKQESIGADISILNQGDAVMNLADDRFEMMLDTDDGAKCCEIRVTDLHQQKTLGYAYFIRDITEQKKMLHELENMASYDPLTQIYNRRRLMEEAEKELLRARRYNWDVSVLMIDLDHFKNVNDRYGHLAGDEVIRAVVRTCSRLVRGTDVFGRYGGEEFVVLMPDANFAKACEIAEYMRMRVDDMQITDHENSIRITISIGVACLPGRDHQQTVENVISWADQALYQAKNGGRNQVARYSGGN
jgi:diguanylate cyclase (GGDEF) domain